MDWWQIIIQVIIVPAIGYLFLAFLSNAKLKSIGNAWGRKVSKWGRKKIGVSNWENIENNFITGLVTLVNAIQEGANEDDSQPNSSGGA